jgi:hypothetical protein
MNCLICNNAETQRIKTMGDWVELNCPDCGHYRVSGDLFADMKPKGQYFDVQKARAWIQGKRRVGVEEAPLIGCPDSGLISPGRSAAGG